MKGEDMEQYKQEFIEFMVASDVLKFGEFTLKSERKSPFFMNAESSDSITHVRSMSITEMILMCCSDRHIRGSP